MLYFVGGVGYGAEVATRSLAAELDAEREEVYLHETEKSSETKNNLRGVVLIGEQFRGVQQQQHPVREETKKPGVRQVRLTAKHPTTHATAENQVCRENAKPTKTEAICESPEPAQ